MTRLSIKKKEKNTYSQRKYLYYNFKSVRKSYFRVSISYFLRYTCLLCIYTARTWMGVFQMSIFIAYSKFGLISIICFEIFNVLQSPPCYFNVHKTTKMWTTTMLQFLFQKVVELSRTYNTSIFRSPRWLSNQPNHQLRTTLKNTYY